MMSLLTEFVDSFVNKMVAVKEMWENKLVFKQEIERTYGG